MLYLPYRQIVVTFVCNFMFRYFLLVILTITGVESIVACFLIKLMN